MAETILAKLAVEVTAKATQFGQVLGQQEKALKGFQNSVSGVSNFLKGALATIGAASLGKEIISVTAEFQRFSAVLINTLGSRSAAQIALRDIEDFAKRTPFAVDELTSSYVKLANQGFKPTTDELRKLGDLASSTGKGFDQLTEAIIDAQTGEFERLKEFGIRASKQGDQVKFTFKGVETQTKFTASAIREYILSLGDAEGVSGAMAAISETLGGQISNLGDSWTQLLKTIGDGNKGPLSGAIAGLTELVNKTRELLKTNSQVKEELQVEGQAAIIEELKQLASVTGDVDASADKLISRLEEEKEAIVNLSAPLFANFEANEEEIEILERKASVIDAQIVAINDYTKAETKRVEAAEEANAKQKASIGIIGDIEKQLKAFEAQKKASFSTDEIAQFNGKIEDLRDKLEVLNASRPLSNFGKRQLSLAEQGFTEEPKDLSQTGSPTGLETDLAVPDITPEMDAYIEQVNRGKQSLKEWGEVHSLWGENQRAEYEASAQAAMQFGDIIGQGLGAAISGQESFAQAMKKTTGELVKLFLTRALAAAFSKAVSETPGPPPVGLAVAAASVGIVSAFFAKLGASGGGGSSGSVSSRPATQTADRTRVQPDGMRIDFDAVFTFQQGALTAAIKSENTRNSRLNG